MRNKSILIFVFLPLICALYLGSCDHVSSPLVDPITGVHTPISPTVIHDFDDNQEEMDEQEREDPPPKPESPPRQEPDPPPPPPVDEISRGDRVIVINTIHLGLRINDDAGKRIGGMFDGETGIVISNVKKAPSLNGDILDWVEIEWDAPVKNPKSGCGNRDVCVGWSAIALADGTKLLKRLD
ncbi:MAG: hypothetical protein OXU23_03530 [Candidatus Poribacteria bacterium]|nr:hypothetical protein [Candidatus Poribacteria bacterium]